MTSRYWDRLHESLIRGRPVSLYQEVAEGDKELAFELNVKTTLAGVRERPGNFYEAMVSNIEFPYMGFYVPPPVFKQCPAKNRQYWHDCYYLQLVEENQLQQLFNDGSLTLEHARNARMDIECEESKETMLKAGFDTRHFKRFLNGSISRQWSSLVIDTLLLRVLRIR